MGDVKSYNPSGGFDQYLYTQVGEPFTAPNGVQGKIITKYSSANNFHESLPKYSNTSEVYLKRSDKGTHPVEQARIYKDRKVVLDFDWGHTHKTFQQGIVHVHEWHYNNQGKWVRCENPRYLNNDEIRKYGDLLKLAYPNIKFRP